MKRLKLDDGQANETQTKSATKITASPTILTLFKNSSCRKNLRLSSCEIDMAEEGSTAKLNEDLLSPKKGLIKANSIEENTKSIASSSKTEVLMDTSENVDSIKHSNNDKENNAVITID